MTKKKLKLSRVEGEATRLRLLQRNQKKKKKKKDLIESS